MAPTHKPTPVSTPLVPAEPDEARSVPVRREELAIVHRPRSAIAEQFRSLRNSITALNPEGASRSIVLTSAVRREGKTVATLNLAIALAEVPGTPVLVVDADLHQPGIESYLDLPRRQGLVEVLRGECSLDRAIRATSIDGVSLLGAGSRPRNSSELLGGERMKVLLAEFKKRFRYILIDTPAALTISDASLLGAIADGILLVVRLGTTQRQDVQEVSNKLENLGGNVLGTCLTGVLTNSSRDNVER